MLITMVAVFAIFYLLIIRPQQKKEKERQAMLSAVKPGDTVTTAGGLIGKVTGTSDRFVVLEISPKVRVRLLRSAITDKDTTVENDTEKKSGKKNKGKKKSNDKNKGQNSSSEKDDSGESKDDE